VVESQYYGLSTGPAAGRQIEVGVAVRSLRRRDDRVAGQAMLTGVPVSVFCA